MRFLFLFLIFPFSSWANDGCDIPEATKICEAAGATKEVPEDQVITKSKDGEEQYFSKDGIKLEKKDDKFVAAEYYFPGVGASVEVDEEAPDCKAGLDKAQDCCNDPVDCLGGEHLSTFNQVNNIATQVGPGLAMLMQGTGSDMSGMCEALQAMAGAGAGLSTAAFTKCKGSISSCYSACDKDIQKNCLTYLNAKIKCKNTLSSEVEQSARQVIKDKEKTKPACKALNAKAGEIMNNIGPMANSALSAELCKKQASAREGKEDCAKVGGRWDGYRCITPEDECEKIGGVWNNEECEEVATVNRGEGDGNLTNSYGEGISLNTEIPGNDTNEYDPDTDNVDVGGGGETPGISGDDSSSSDLLSGLKSSDTNKAEEVSPTELAAAGKKGSYRGGRLSGFGRGYGGSRSAEGTPGYGSDKDKQGLSMGGGGFRGYGGGGSGDGDNSYASLGLSKKKLKELEKKAGAKRKTASEGLGGAHQNIFERITKRFQSLCKNKLDCR